MTQFKDLGLGTELLKGLTELGFKEPSEIQAEAIPFILKNKQDLIALAQTGTGKTAAFSLPILEKMDAEKKDLQAMVICPTRELCLQISEDINKFSKHLKGIKVVSVYGGERIDLQIRHLRSGANIVVGTPGRLHDLIRRKQLKLSELKYLVLDEADEMLDMGFKDDLDAILEGTSENRRTLLFSATFSNSVRRIANQYMKEAKEIKVGKENSGAKNVKHEYFVIGPGDRYEALERIIDSLDDVYGIIFCRTKIETQAVADKLKKSGYDAEALHGDITQNIRTKIMANFKKRNISLLVATDVAARGIDVGNLSHVINYNLPDQLEAYTHRSGRTGRAGSRGISLSLCDSRDKRHVSRLEKIIGQNFEYKKVPSGEEIINNKINNYISKIEAEASALEENSYFDSIIDRLKKIKKEELIKFLIQEKFSRLITNGTDKRDLNVDFKSSIDPCSQVLRINIGRKQKADIKTIFGLVNSKKEIKGVGIGRIIIEADHTKVSVADNDADRIIDALNNETWRGLKLKIEKSDEILSRSRYSRGGSNRRPDRNRGRSRGRRR